MAAVAADAAPAGGSCGEDKPIIRDFDGSDADFEKLNALDELMCSELKEEGKPDHTSYGMGWFKMRCEPERKSYQNWHTLSLEQSSSSGSGSGSSGSGGGPCGFCLFSRETMAAKGKGKKRRRTAYMELFFIAVDPSLRGQRLGTVLLEASIAKAQALWDDITAVRLHVMSNNAAVRFYERAGFEVSATKPDYPAGYTAYRMVKELEPTK